MAAVVFFIYFQTLNFSLEKLGILIFLVVLASELGAKVEIYFECLLESTLNQYKLLNINSHTLRIAFIDRVYPLASVKITNVLAGIVRVY